MVKSDNSYRLHNGVDATPQIFLTVQLLQATVHSHTRFLFLAYTTSSAVGDSTEDTIKRDLQIDEIDSFRHFVKELAHRWP